MGEGVSQMSKGTKRHFSDEIKRQAVDDYVSGRKSAAQVAAELEIGQSMVYRWRADLQAQARGERIESLEAQGINPGQARRIIELEEQLEVYQKKVAQQAVEIDLLKKIQGSANSQPESELTGLINTIKQLDRKKGRVK